MKSMNNTTGEHRELPEDMLTKEQVSFIQFPFTLSAYEVKNNCCFFERLFKGKKNRMECLFSF